MLAMHTTIPVRYQCIEYKWTSFWMESKGRNQTNKYTKLCYIVINITFSKLGQESLLKAYLPQNQSHFSN